MSDTWLDENLPSVEEIQRRLRQIIPGTLDPDGWGRREIAAKTIFVMLYGYAVEGYDQWIRPTAVTDMTDVQAARQEPEIRREWLKTVQGGNRPQVVGWYSENTRESIRDETLRTFLRLGVSIEREGLPTTSPKPRYALDRGFAELLSPRLSGSTLTTAIDTWQEEHLSAAELARLVLKRKRAGASSARVLVRLPNGETRSLAPGDSSSLTKAVIEELAPRFLGQAAVIAISESAQKLGYRDHELSEAIGLTIDVSGTLPDVILADLDSQPPLIVFVECVVTDGPVSDRRLDELATLARRGGYQASDCAFVTAFLDRSDSPYRKMSASLAWGTFVWFLSEPDHIVLLRRGSRERSTSLARLLGRG